MGLTLTRRSNVRPSRVGKHLTISDDSYANLVGTALKSNYYRHCNYKACLSKEESNSVKTNAFGSSQDAHLRPFKY